jgi:uncharacterized protein (DUF1778 family)
MKTMPAAKPQDTDRPSGKTARLEARITEEQRAAAITGRSLTDFVVLSTHEIAVRTVREHDVRTLSARDREVFVSALLKPQLHQNGYGRRLDVINAR